MTNPVENDINAIIQTAVTARVEAAVLEALSADGTMRAFVVAALQKKVSTGGYGRDEKPLITHLLQGAIEEQTKAVVAEEIAARADDIRAEVRTALGKSIGVIADSLVDGLLTNAAGRYPSIHVEFRGKGD